MTERLQPGDMATVLHVEFLEKLDADNRMQYTLLPGDTVMIRGTYTPPTKPDTVLYVVDVPHLGLHGVALHVECLRPWHDETPMPSVACPYFLGEESESEVVAVSGNTPTETMPSQSQVMPLGKWLSVNGSSDFTVTSTITVSGMSDTVNQSALNMKTVPTGLGLLGTGVVCSAGENA